MISSVMLQSHLKSMPWSVWLNSSISFLCLSLLSIFVLRKVSLNPSFRIQYWINLIVNEAKKPILVLIGLYIIYFTLYITAFFLPTKFQKLDELLFTILPVCIMWSAFLLLLWFVWKLSSAIQGILKGNPAPESLSTARIILPIVNNILHAIILLIAACFITSELSVSGTTKVFLDKFLHIYLICTLGWIFYEVVNGIEKLILRQFDITSSVNFSARKVQTQVLILKRIILAIGFIVLLASILYVFDSVKRLGTGLLTTAGIISAVGAFASQQSLGRLVSGLQLAFTQPIRIGDTVVVDDQMGVVEEITISYVVVKLWDLRRLIIPTDNIMSRGFQNLTRTSTELLGTIYFHIDYLLPIHLLRDQFIKLVSQSTLWDKNLCCLQVTDLKEHTLEVRGLVSAKNGADLWALRCEIREKMLEFIVSHFPDCLPKVRQVSLDK